MGRSWVHGLAMATAQIALLAGCTNGDAGSSSRWELLLEPITTRFIQVQDKDDPGNVAALIDGLPAESTGNAGLNASGTAIAAVISGGGAQIDLTSTTPFTKVQVTIEGLILYYELTLAPSTTSVSLIIALSTTIPIENFTAVFRLGDGAGSWGDAFEVPMLALSIPSGEVQVSVSWNAPTDVDLHVIDPSGERIYFANKTSASGGSLDLDSNPACSIDNINNESIHWPEGQAPAGSYDVEVVYFDSCGLASQYIVVVQRKGHDPLLFTGSFAAGDSGVTDAVTMFAFP